MSTKPLCVAVFCICLWHFTAPVDKRLLMVSQDSFGSTLKSLELEIQQLKTQQTSSEIQLQAATAELRQVKTKLQTSEQELLRVNSVLSSIQKESAKTTGTTFVRWGRKTCPSGNTTELVYSGVTGGSIWNETGGAVDYLCTKCFSGVYGSEYELEYNNVKMDDDVPCAVCHITSSSTLMVPAHDSCPDGWEKEYQGLLCTGCDANRAASQYVCLDNDPEYFEGTRSHDDNGKLFYPVKTVCGSLPCPPYQNDKFLPCVVCSK